MTTHRCDRLRTFPSTIPSLGCPRLVLMLDGIAPACATPAKAFVISLGAMPLTMRDTIMPSASSRQRSPQCNHDDQLAREGSYAWDAPAIVISCSLTTDCSQASWEILHPLYPVLYPLSAPFKPSSITTERLRRDSCQQYRFQSPQRGSFVWYSSGQQTTSVTLFTVL
jgi:hypothetical protein